LPEVTDRATRRGHVPSWVTLTLLIVLPFALPVAWVVGAVVVWVERRQGWRATLAMSVGGLYLPMFLYGQTIDGGLPPGLGYLLAAATLLGCFVATHRILSH
jgi:Na+-translocating ferredoxin:NAD+ oxidoreductase RnfD subunit